MDKAKRNELRKSVINCRKALEASIGDELEGQYGIYQNGKVDDSSFITHLSEEDQAFREQLLVHLRHIESSGFKSQEAVEQLIREVVFTHLNRLCAYKMMEVRGLIKETVSKGLNSNGFKFYLADHDEDERLWKTGKQYQAYKHYLEWLGSSLSEEIGVLFSPHDPANRLFPKQPVLEEVLGYINTNELSNIWDNDETIGWIYQYFTPKELREKARKESQAPRNSYELAFRNQFFTPRYVVEFLTDNTLGRTWYEMRKGKTTLKEKCEYLVIRPNEIFLESGEEPPYDANENEELSNEELLKKPFYIIQCDKKDPREIKILDPACGSGHFLLYCFDILEIIYEEAYDDPELGPKLKEDYSSLDDLKKAVPSLILGRNLFGVDIDLRATQIAALALWLRAQKSYRVHGLNSVNRPRITRSNIVVAEPMPGNQGMLNDFIMGLKPPIIGQLVETVFEKMKLAGEAGTLLKIEEEIKAVISDAKKRWLNKPTNVQIDLFGGKISGTSQVSLDFRGITDQDFWDQAESRVIESLHDYAEMATSQEKLARQLFADDTVHGFAFIDICRKKFDVILMNPPFGVATQGTKAYFNKFYPNWNNNLLCCFIERVFLLVGKKGKIGAIYDKTAWIKLTYENFRRNILLEMGTFSVSADLGWEVLDANVEVVASIISKSTSKYESGLFFDLKSVPPEKKGTFLQNHICRKNGENLLNEYTATNTEILHLPNAVIAYDILPYVKKLFSTCNSFIDSGFQSYVGAQIRSEQHFFLHWERSQDEGLTPMDKYCHLYNGGENIRFYIPPREIVLFGPNGSFVNQSDESYTWRLRLNSTGAHYYKPGVGFGKRGEYLDAHFLRKNHLFTVEGQSMPISEVEDIWLILGLLNSSTYQVIINTFCGQHKTTGYMNLLPIPKINDEIRTKIINLIKQQYSIISNLYKHELTNLTFCQNPILANKHVGNLKQIGGQVSEEIQSSYNTLRNLFKDLNHLIKSVCGVSQKRELLEVNGVENSILEDGLPNIEIDLLSIIRNLIDYLVGIIFGLWDIRIALDSSLIAELPKPPECPPNIPPSALISPSGFLAKSENIVSEEWLRARPNVNTLSPEDRVKDITILDSEYPLSVKWDGIIVDDINNENDIIHLIKNTLDIVWDDNAETIEQELCEIIKVTTLRDYFRKLGSDGFWMDHIKRYSNSRRKAPLYWLLQSYNKNYALWIYYHRLDKDLYYKALVNYVDPKVRLEEDRLKQLRTQLAEMGSGGHDVKKLEKEIEKLEDFVSELHDFRDKLKRVAELNLDYDLDDGVILNIALLHELVPWPEAKKYWDELKAGKYEWSTISKQLKNKGLI